MVTIILVTLLILGITFYQTIQGCFSAMIMAILTVLSAVVAFNYYEPLGHFLAGGLGAMADPAAMVLVFVIPLFLMRIAFDRLISGNVVLGLWPDRIGGASFGFVTAMIMTGVFMIIFQMLPMPASIIGWQPYDSGLGVKDSGPPRWASNFTTATVKHLSSGPLGPIMSGGNKFSVAHDNLMLESFCLRNRPKGARASTPAEALEIANACIVELPDDDHLAKLKLSVADKARLKRVISHIQDSTPEYPLLSQAEKDDTKVLLIRVTIDESARNENDNWWRLPATHFRMVCESGRSFYPVGYLTYSGRWQVNTSVSDELVTQIGDILVARPGKAKGGPPKLVVDWLYRIPSDQKPQYVAFRRTNAVAMPSITRGLSNATGKGAQQALSVEPVSGQTKLQPIRAGRKLFTPDVVKVRERLPDGIVIRFKEDPRPEAIKPPVQITDEKLQKILIDGPIAESSHSKKRGAKYVTELYLEGQGTALIFLECGVNPDGPLTDIENMRPMLLLSTEESIPHNGAYFFYKAASKDHVYFYYDSSTTKDKLDPDFVRVFRDNLAKAGRFGIIFSVPTTKGANIVGVTFGVGSNYEFHTVKPLACGIKRHKRGRR